ncbi:Methylase involved in ubiquinone/menaquinone biosynthesis-like [Synechococcus sp. CC9902]|uniref:class I SAM-dependent methyltransferase n=1 Tax=Synechococcus sp. (strain CC9902) TaxID=316279 RepID=UPI00005D3CC4|nr:class I SAM-dependent methyltransferase [Synechococcus sp. CC9902]ABB25018.1 Methylase involved in ubiquinone/menaquinone biosynthesis-like [Synechococcus sp. CC9902]
MSPPSSSVGFQGDEFLRGEADAWFERNHSHGKVSSAMRLLGEWCAPHKSEVGRILEIGAGTGLPLAFLSDFLEADGVGIEPSKQAVENWETLRHEVGGGARVSMSVGLASDLPFEDKSFDLVLFGFCLYLVDRSLLYRAVAEADRVLRDGGFLAIHEFDSQSAYANEYSHRQGILSYKNDYSNIFTSSGHYYLVSKHSHAHLAEHFAPDIDERVSLSLLYKQESAVYAFGRRFPRSSGS